MSNNDSWVRDCGPTFVTNGKEIRGVDWEFNAWGGLVDGLYFPWDKDDVIPRKIAEIEELIVDNGFDIGKNVNSDIKALNPYN